MDVSVIIPAYNEGASIGELLQRIAALKLDGEVIVVDDCSVDRTREIATDAGVKVLSHPYRMGNGAAVKTGMRKAKGDIILLLDADLQHPPEIIPQILKKMEVFDMVVAARTSKSDVSLFRSAGNFILRRVAQSLTQHKIPDLTSGFRAVRRDLAMEFIHLLPNGFSYPTTLTLSFLKTGYFVGYENVESIKKREQGKSKIQPFKNGFEFVLLIMRIIMLFDPLRIFMPVSMLFFALGAGLVIHQLIVFGAVKGGSVLALLTAVFLFFFGLIADQSAAIRRELRRKTGEN
ncbi:MAG: glycosyl transferase [Elusimicrobia bacterium CG_4_8_14_3_um_filter_50_9]|nr:MAG: glycosyl transferase [Elusimicrobia bacterium CG_4_8_14_3_um_filter_50_9]